jgi:hypothetical protein
MSESGDGIRADLDKLVDRPAPRSPSGASQPLPPWADAPAIEVGPSPGGYVAAVSVVCFLAVAFTSPLNITLLLVSARLVEECFGGYVADNSPALLICLTVAIQTSLFTVFWLPAVFITRKRSVAVRTGGVAALTLAYLGLWIGWTIWLAAEMTRTNTWP